MKELKRQSNFKPTPTVEITKKVGGYLEGTLVGSPKEYTSTYGAQKTTKYIYTLKVSDTDFPVTVKVDDVSKEAEVEEGDEVAVFANKYLHNRLRQASEGSKVRIEYVGKEKLDNGFNSHAFKVFQF